LSTVYLSLGSNLGDRLQYLKKAIRKIKESDKISIKKISSVYETEPVVCENQPQFLNLVLEAQTSLAPLPLLERLLSIEKEMGRKREEKWGPRNVDVDILLYADQIVKSDRLAIPHPRMHQRKFVLVPLAQIAPQTLHPLLKKNVKEILESCDDDSAVNIFMEKI
jgi:2-amino-4-hydroxy-6-hydroxymethyldihydropteridine diphosphokinase